MSKKVVILGGGVAGMSAAHELIERGFEVEVYEKHSIPGGKARSIPKPDSGTEGRPDLPGEHGFRFFPRFYTHITDTMSRIPYEDNKKGVLGNLVQTTRMLMARFGEPGLTLLPRFPKSLADLKVLIREVFDSDLGISEEGKDFFAERIWQLMTSCHPRRLAEYEKIGWWEYLEADRFSESYQTILAKGLTRTLVAAKAKEASTKTGGDIFLQLIFDMALPGPSSDQLLDGPTNDVWIDPWLEFLREKGVNYFLDTTVKSIQLKGQQIDHVIIERDGVEQTVRGDYYLSAVPVEVMAELLNDQMTKIDPTLNNLKKLKNDVAWMNGLQLYLKKDVPIVHGHAIYSDTPWALTSISQAQFWGDYDLSEYGDGQVNGIISIDISDWNTPGILEHGPDGEHKTAKECTKQQIVDEVWAQLKRSLNVEGKTVLKDENLHSWFLDPDIQKNPHLDPERESLYENEEPLLVNKINSWDLRPTAHTRIPNFYLASDYVRTFTDLATMEGANEAARRAVNCIIDAAEIDADYCRVWDLHEPDILHPFRKADLNRFNKGLPWNGELSFIHKLEIIWKIIKHRLLRLFK